MYLLGKPFVEIDWATLERAQDEKIEESRSLDFKRNLPDVNSKESKRDFLEDVCAFANTNGGLLLYGVEEARDAHTKLGHIRSLPGVGDKVPIDFKPRTEELVRSSFDPRFSGVQIDWIESPNGSARILKVGVERSARAPHRVNSNGSREFMVRSISSSEKMDAEQIRGAIRRSFEARSDAEGRLAGSVKRMLTEAVPHFEVADINLVWMAAVPVFPDALTLPVRSHELQQVMNAHRRTNDAIGWTQLGYDHLGIHLRLRENPYRVLRVNRDGTVERRGFVDRSTTHINKGQLRGEISSMFRVVGDVRSRLGIGGPTLVVVGLNNVAGLRVEQFFPPAQGVRAMPAVAEILEANLVSPTAEIEDEESFRRHLKEVADFIWQSAGHQACDGIADDGGTVSGMS